MANYLESLGPSRQRVHTQRRVTSAECVYSCLSLPLLFQLGPSLGLYSPCRRPRTSDASSSARSTSGGMLSGQLMPLPSSPTNANTAGHGSTQRKGFESND